MPLSSVLCLGLWCKESSRSDLHPVPIRNERPAQGTSQISRSLSSCYVWPTPREVDPVVFPSIPLSRLPNSHTICLHRKCLRCTCARPQPTRANIPHTIHPGEAIPGHWHDRALLEDHDTDAPALQDGDAAISSRGLWNHHMGTPAGASQRPVRGVLRIWGLLVCSTKHSGYK